MIDHDEGSYAVKSGAKEFVIYAPALDHQGGESWERATVAFFTIVNDQLVPFGHRQPFSNSMSKQNIKKITAELQKRVEHLETTNQTVEPKKLDSMGRIGWRSGYSSGCISLEKDQ